VADKKSAAASKRTTESAISWFVLLREISCGFVDHTIHEITLSYAKEHEL